MAFPIFMKEMKKSYEYKNGKNMQTAENTFKEYVFLLPFWYHGNCGDFIYIRAYFMPFAILKTIKGFKRVFI